MRTNLAKVAVAGLTALASFIAISTPAMAQSSGGASMAPFQSGYGASRYTTSRNTTGSTRDVNGNRLVVNGIIQAGASSYSETKSGVSNSSSASGSSANGTSIGGATAIGNSLNVVVQGNRNTVVVNSNQTNNGNISAGTVLNGTLVFP